MYLLMLLATFISAIYGYNLSVRADYDRDVAKKKAMGVVYRFMFQEKAAADLLHRISNGEYTNTGYGIRWLLPNDMVYADFDSNEVKYNNNKYTTFFLKQNGTVDLFYLRKYANYKTRSVNRNKGVDGENYLESGRRLFDGSVMMTKLLCLNKLMQDNGATNCTPDYVDPDNPSAGVVGTCCDRSENYLVSYRKIDSRWINRINQGISLDFMRAIVDRNYSDNIGIIHWENGNWYFQGKINFSAAYAEEERKYEEAHKNDEGPTKYFPDDRKNQATWKLPNYVFTENFFVDKNGENMCERGCLFRIRGF